MQIGPYETLGELGRGGAATVYRARSPEGREVALKLVSPRKGRESLLVRFERERRLLSAFGEREGFVPLLDAGDSPKGPFLVMPLVPGGTLRRKLRGPLGVEETIALGRALASALGRAHERGVVHRDLKPENVLFGRDGTPLVADLGLAKHFRGDAPDAAESASLSRSGTFRGTLGYGAPEQMRDAKSVGPPADVFSLGAILYECLAGRPAFAGESAVEAIQRIEACSPSPLAALRPDAPSWLVDTIERALARSPGERFRDGAELERALAERSGGRASRRVLAATFLAPLAVAAVALALVFRGEEPAPREETPAPPPSPRGPTASDLVTRGSLAFDRGDLDAALADMVRAIALDPTLAPAWHVRGCVRLQKHDLEGALADFDRAIELDPKLAAAWEHRGLARETKGDLDRALADYERSIAVGPNVAAARFRHASVLSRRGDAKGAIAEYSRAVELDPKLALAWANRAFLRSRQGDDDGALADASRAIELDPKLATGWGSRGDARAGKGDLEGAIADYSRAIDLDPKAAGPWRSRGNVRNMKGEYEAALADCSRAIELERKDAESWCARGAVHATKGDHDAAIADSTRAIELDAKCVAAWRNRGYARFRKNDLDGAIADSSRAVELDPKLAGAWLDLGDARWMSGDARGARTDYERYLELLPGGASAPRVREWLEKNPR